MQTEPTSSDLRVTRRLALHGGWALPATWMLARVGERAQVDTQEIDDFLRRWLDETVRLVEEEEPNEDAHLHGLCADLARLDPGAFPERERVAYQKDGMTSGPVFAEMPFIVIQFDLEPGAVIGAHNHVGWSFVSCGVKGDAAVRHFETMGECPEPGQDPDVEFEVREVSSARLTHGVTSSLTRARANIHWFEAGEEGATFLDFGVKLPDPGDGPKEFAKLDFDPEPVDARRRIHRAHWIAPEK
jgi:hypothetical protein